MSDSRVRFRVDLVFGLLWFQHVQSWRRFKSCWKKQMGLCMRIWARGWGTLHWQKVWRVLKLHRLVILDKEWALDRYAFIHLVKRCHKRSEPHRTWSKSFEFAAWTIIWNILDILNILCISFLQTSSSQIKVRQLLTPDYVTTMAAIYGMLQQDFTMQVSYNHCALLISLFWSNCFKVHQCSFS